MTALADCAVIVLGWTVFVGLIIWHPWRRPSKLVRRVRRYTQ